MKLVKMSLLTLFHPTTAFSYIQQERDHFRWSPVIFLLALAIAVKVFALQFTHYPLTTTGSHVNLLFECAKMFVPLISWAIASYLVTTILDGEMFFRESLLATSYALVPYVVITVPLTLLSRILEVNQQGMFRVLEGAALGWVVLLIIISIKVMNHFTGKQTVLILLLSLCTVVILWVAVALVYTISMQFLDFIKEVFVELRYRL